MLPVVFVPVVEALVTALATVVVQKQVYLNLCVKPPLLMTLLSVCFGTDFLPVVSGMRLLFGLRPESGGNVLLTRH